MTEAEQLALRNEALQRECDRLRAGLAGLEAELAQLRATIGRLREQTYSLAAQVTRTP